MFCFILIIKIIVKHVLKNTFLNDYFVLCCFKVFGIVFNIENNVFVLVDFIIYF